jgi:hypothetical protein
MFQACTLEEQQATMARMKSVLAEQHTSALRHKTAGHPKENSRKTARAYQRDEQHCEGRSCFGSQSTSCSYEDNLARRTETRSGGRDTKAGGYGLTDFIGMRRPTALSFSRITTGSITPFIRSRTWPSGKLRRKYSM